jgi:hypothetical protein
MENILNLLEIAAGVGVLFFFIAKSARAENEAENLRQELQRKRRDEQ